MIGYANGTIRIISLTDLSDSKTYKIDLEEDEELTSGSYSYNGINWAIGTNFGNVILGAPKRDLMKQPDGIITTKVEGLMRTKDHGVTSI